jgi:hypothetical protein
MGVAEAQKPPEPGQSGVRVRQPEAGVMMSPLIRRFDTDGDGKVSEAEWTAHMHKQYAQMSERLDTDHDGKISENEFIAEGRKNFGKMDANGDGLVTAEEWQDQASKMMMGRRHGLPKKVVRDLQGSEGATPPKPAPSSPVQPSGKAP